MTQKVWTGPRGPSYCCCQGDSRALAVGLETCSVTISVGGSFTFGSTVSDAGWSSAAWAGFEATPAVGEVGSQINPAMKGKE